MPYSTIHLATGKTSWRILSLLRLGERRIGVLKRTMGMTESAFSHALKRLELKGLVAATKHGREKSAKLTDSGRIVFSNLQAICFTLQGHDGTIVEDDSSLVNCLRQESESG